MRNMWRLRVAVVVFSVFVSGFVTVLAQEMDPEVICRIYGLSSIEEAGEEEISELRDYMDHPFRLNEQSHTRLKNCPLFSPYQAASLCDYISRTGYILSTFELAMVDGFTPESARAYSGFLDFSSPAKDSNIRRSAQDLSIRSGMQYNDSRYPVRYTAAVKYSAEIRNSFSLRAGLNWPETRSESWPFDGTFHLNWHSRKLSVFMGDMNLRYGQGLVLWTGVSFSSLPSFSLLMKVPRSVSIPDSYTGGSAMTGLSVQTELDKTVLTTTLALEGLRKGKYDLVPSLNVTWYGRRLRLGHTLVFFKNLKGNGGPVYALSSIDWSSCLGGTDIFGELALDWRNFMPAVMAGFRQPLGENFNLALSCRSFHPEYRPFASGPVSSGSEGTNETGGCVILKYHKGKHLMEVKADFAWHPDDLRTIVADDWQTRSAADYIFSGRNSTFSAKYSFKIRGNFSGRQESRYSSFLPRHELRLDYAFIRPVWELALRTHFQYSRSFSFLTYAEESIKVKSLRLYLRQGAFATDYWEDRIYAYDRSFPGSFSVRPHYGKGLWTAFYSTLDIGKATRLSIKASYETWPWNATKKSGRAGLEFMCSFIF